MSSWESMSATLKPEHWGLHGGMAPDTCGAGLPNAGHRCTVSENGLFEPFIYKKRSVYQDRLGTNIGKHSKKTLPFFFRVATLCRNATTPATPSSSHTSVRKKKTSFLQCLFNTENRVFAKTGSGPI